MAGFDITGLSSIFDMGSKIIDKIFPDPAQRDAAKLELIKQQQQGNLAELQIQMSAILAEAQSADPLTSRSRPAFLYVMYIMILFSLPIGILTAFKPEMAGAIANGMKLWLAAIPDALWALFGAGYLGYTTARSVEKVKGVST